MSDPVELFRKYRPKVLDEIVGQEGAVSTLKGMFAANAVPHAILISGPSGTGKTTLARIIKDALGCDDADYQEINAADKRLLEDVRHVLNTKNSAALKGDVRVWCWDEAHHLSRREGGDAQTALLKLLEEPPSHCYFILCTTDPDQLRPAIRNRCTQLTLNNLSPEALFVILVDVVAQEGVTVHSGVITRIAECSEGSARQALKTLESVIRLPESERLEFVQKSSVQGVAFDVVRALVWDKKPSWPAVAKIIAALDEGENWEGLRYLVLANASKELLKAGPNSARANHVLVCFGSNFHDSKRAGFVQACYECVERSK